MVGIGGLNSMKSGKATRQTKMPWTLRRVLVLLVAVAVLPSLAIQAVVLQRWQASNRREQQAANLEVARAVGELFQGHVDNLARTEGAIAESLVRLPPGMPDEVNEMLAAQAAEYPSVSTLSLVDLRGEVVASSRREDIGSQVGDRPYFQRAMAAGPNGWVVSDLLDRGGSDEPAVIVARAVYDNGRPIGMLGALVEPERFARAAVQLQRVEGGTILLFDRTGRLVYRSPAVDLSDAQREAFRSPMLSAALEGREAQGEFTSPVTGMHMMAARVPAGPAGWVAGADREAERINAPVWAAVRNALGAELAILAACVGVLLLTGRAIRWDAGRLNRQMAAAARGEPAPAERVRIGEFRALSEGFAAAVDQRRGAEQALRESEQRYRSLFNNNHAVMLLLDPADGRIVDANPAAVAFYGYRLSDLKAMAITEINTLPGDEVRRQMAQARQGDHRSFRFEHRLASGEVRNVQVYSGPISVRGRELIYSIIHDVTDQVHAEQARADLMNTLEQRVAERTAEAVERAEQIQALAVELTGAEQRERGRLARLLHDHLQQLLVAVRMRAGSARNRTGDEAVRNALDDVDGLIGESLDATRELMVDLSPPVLERAPLAEGMAWLAEWMHGKYGLEVDLEVDPDARADSPDAKAFIFRTARELLFNVVKHAGVTEARLVLARADSTLRLVVSDNGRGFSVHEHRAGRGEHEHFGLATIRDRLRLLGGRMDIRSAPDQGTTTTVQFPLRLGGRDH